MSEATRTVQDSNITIIEQIIQGRGGASSTSSPLSYSPYIKVRIEQNRLKNQSYAEASLYIDTTSNKTNITEPDERQGDFNITIEFLGSSYTKSVQAKTVYFYTYNSNDAGADQFIVSTSASFSHITGGASRGDIKISVGGGFNYGFNPMTFDDEDMTVSVPRICPLPSSSDFTVNERTELGMPMQMGWYPCAEEWMGYRFCVNLGAKSLETRLLTYGTDFALETFTLPSEGLTLPIEWAKEIAYDKTEATVTATLIAYDSEVEIGRIAKNFMVVIPENDDTRPDAEMSLSPKHTLLDKFSSAYIQRKSKLRIDGISASARLGAKITRVSVEVSCDTFTYDKYYAYTNAAGDDADTNVSVACDGCETDDVFILDGKVKVTLTALDSRGFESSVDKTFDVIPYSTPVVVPYGEDKYIVCERSADNCLRIKAGRRYSSCLSGEVQLNTCQLQYRYAGAGDELTDVEWATLITGETAEDGIDKKIGEAKLSENAAYVVQLRVIDDVGESDIFTESISTARVYMHEAGSLGSLGFGEYATEENCISIATDINVFGRVLGLGKCRRTLEDNEDVNDLTTISVYSVPDNPGVTHNIRNLPTDADVGGVLIVSSADGTGYTEGENVYLLQSFVPKTAEARYYRSCYTDNSGNWEHGDWYKLGLEKC